MVVSRQKRGEIAAAAQVGWYSRTPLNSKHYCAYRISFFLLLTVVKVTLSFQLLKVYFATQYRSATVPRGGGGKRFRSLDLMKLCGKKEEERERERPATCIKTQDGNGNGRGGREMREAGGRKEGRKPLLSQSESVTPPPPPLPLPSPSPSPPPSCC